MNNWREHARTLGAAIIVALLLLAAGSYLLFGSVGNGLKLVRAMYTIRHNYVHAPDPNDLVDHALAGMVQGLGDPYSYYLPSKEYARLTQAVEGKLVGIGVLLSATADGAKIITVFAGGPADAAKLPPGSIIVGVDGEDVRGWDLSQIVAKIQGPAGSSVRLQLLRTDGTELETELQRQAFTIPTTEQRMLENDIGYLRIIQFTDETPAAVDAALADLRYNGMRKLVLDLRKNPGGSLQAVTKVAAHFLPAGEVVRIVPRNGTAETFRTTGREYEFPVAVLIDQDSASASEILAAAVQDWESGTLIGRTTYGKGTVQAILPLTGSEGVRLTIAEYYSPKGRTINGHGVEPDITLSEEEVDTPAALTAALNHLRNQ